MSLPAVSGVVTPPPWDDALEGACSQVPGSLRNVMIKGHRGNCGQSLGAGVQSQLCPSGSQLSLSFPHTFTRKAMGCDPRQRLPAHVAVRGPCVGAGVPVVCAREMVHAVLGGLER